ncbi:hypothetical protein TNIN_20441 [Trichonephila inaurata madagascariensis]|uniref:Uncharacterized protein n=1 Tax=Trichonephila inaurata madagascariensis TaxID=2747483 RepID=A0A8X7BSP4_9ARAC|nr:hypothetical protein TNIN_20441 [Trichonephila inaurata madagascariensis]
MERRTIRMTEEIPVNPAKISLTSPGKSGGRIRVVMSAHQGSREIQKRHPGQRKIGSSHMIAYLVSGTVASKAGSHCR